MVVQECDFRKVFSGLDDSVMLSCLAPGFESLLKAGCNEVTQCADKGYETKIPPLFRFTICLRCFPLLSVWIALLGRAYVPNSGLGTILQELMCHLLMPSISICSFFADKGLTVNQPTVFSPLRFLFVIYFKKDETFLVKERLQSPLGNAAFNQYISGTILCDISDMLPLNELLRQKCNCTVLISFKLWTDSGSPVKELTNTATKVLGLSSFCFFDGISPVPSVVNSILKLLLPQLISAQCFFIQCDIICL